MIDTSIIFGTVLGTSMHGWREYGTTEFTNHDTFVACDASVAVFDDEYHAVTGAAVTSVGTWWSWRVFAQRVNPNEDGQLSNWAEHVTAFVTLGKMRQGILMTDCVAVANNGGRLLRGELLPLRGGMRRMVQRFGALPRVEPCWTKKMMMYDRNDKLHRRAHLVARETRIACDDDYDHDLTSQCDMIVRLWSGDRSCTPRR